MRDEDFTYFISKFGEATKCTAVPTAIFEKWRNKLPDQLLKYWEQEGLCEYADGLFCTVDPDPQEVLSSQVNIDGSPYESVGFIVLLNLGMTLTGFHDDDIYQRAVTVFAQARWDGELRDLKPFDLANF